MTDEESHDGAIRFTGNWREFAPIAFTNLLLIIVTLGVYSFWARARVRRYLWSHTHVIDDSLEWTGTGLELFLGYLLAIVLFIAPFTLLNLVLQGVLLRGHAGYAGILGVGLYVWLLYLAGVAIFRGLRYRLSRTLWHGIRGGSDDRGFAFGLSYLWRTVVGIFALGLMVPWSMVKLSNEKWNAMSFGPHRFDADAQWGPVFGRYLLFYLVPIVLLVVAGIGMAFAKPMLSSIDPNQPGGAMATFILVAVLFYVLYFGVLGVIACAFWAAYINQVVSMMSIAGLNFEFTAGTWAWIKLFLTNVLLVVCTLGIGYLFVGYRNWAFYIRHLEAMGTVQLDEMTQSTTRAPRQGEGLLDAFDMGAL